MKKNKLALGGAVLAAFAASLCCVAPLLFVLLGLGAFGAAAVFETARPYLLGIATLLLAFGFYRAYFQRREACPPLEACTAKPVGKAGRTGLWLATAAVMAFALSPYYAGTLATLLNRQSNQNAATKRPAIPAPQAPVVAPAASEATLKIEGMTCASCETTVRLVLEKTPGVHSAAVSFDRGEAVVKYDPSKVTPAQLAQSVNENTDYKATPQKSEGCC